MCGAPGVYGIDICVLQLAGIFALVNDRLSTLEDTVRSQQEMLMELSYQIDSKENGPRLPFISGVSPNLCARAEGMGEVWCVSVMMQTNACITLSHSRDSTWYCSADQVHCMSDLRLFEDVCADLLRRPTVSIALHMQASSAMALEGLQ